MFAIVLASFLFVIILNAFTFMSFVSFRTHVFGVKTLQLPVYLSKLILNLSLKGFKSARVGLATDGPSF